MDALKAWFRQPSTLVAAGLVVGAVVFWFSGNAALAAMAAAAIPGAVNDHSRAMLEKIEGLETAAKTIEVK